jgi:hypothetical protein
VFSRLRRALRPQPIPDALWRAALARTHHARSLPLAARRKLRAHATRFLHTKTFEPAHDFVVTDLARVVVAMRACLPVLELGLDYYEEWVSIIIYPGDFRVRHTYTDEIGVEHHYVDELCGESQNQGPIVLSWDTIENQNGAAGADLVIHECAHKLDILNGAANGFPPLHAGMNRHTWTQAFARAFNQFTAAVERGEATELDPYAATDAAEYFAVTSETFFTQPAWIARPYPEVYDQLRLYYRQDPLGRLGRQRRA